MMEFQKKLVGKPTDIPGLLIFDLPVHGDSRGWFKENWQREKMILAGLPDFCPVQNNISFNDKVGTTRGIHAEPWDKFISVSSGKIFGAWVDLRDGESFGKVFTAEIDPSQAIFVPRGVANSYQTLESETSYVYLVNDHWSADAQYTFLNMADETVDIQWPIPLSEVVISDKDRDHPRLHDVVPMPPRKTLILGADGQLGRALRAEYRDDISVEFADRRQFDLLDESSYSSRRWGDYHTIINAAAYTAVDNAEGNQGRKDAWAVNASAVSRLARVANENCITLVHISTDYVFDGTLSEYSEDEDFSPLGVYGQSKAAGDIIVSSVPRHYIIRTSWVIGDGPNFVRTMSGLAYRGVKPSVVKDQIGRLTFTSDIASAVKFLLSQNADFGTYNVTSDGTPQSWSEIAGEIFVFHGLSATSVSGVTTDEYFKGKDSAPRPLCSILSLDKIKSAGFRPRESSEALAEYLVQDQATP